MEKQYGIDEDKLAHRLFKRLIRLGAVDERESEGPGRMFREGRKYYEISPVVCEIADDVRRENAERAEPSDRVDATTKWARSHPLWSKLLLALAVATFLVTLLNQAVELIKNIAGDN